MQDSEGFFGKKSTKIYQKFYSHPDFMLDIQVKEQAII
ncbi:MAG: hypothetical protein ACJARX_001776 [Psychroserpens sp.]|jgi:hypothetical protein